jgi:hypothetical protein
MSTFYLLPPRAFLGERLAGALEGVVPGLRWTDAGLAQLADAVSAAVAGHPDVYVVHREDLPDGEDPARALADGFGAEPDDEVVEVRAGGPRRWRVAG